ncbi:hypothetical protein AAVH_08961 [Aphelenchoides avenae]|nr:hypothetical protein AAVH_08961 [Aphelenchus avenae]
MQRNADLGKERINPQSSSSRSRGLKRVYHCPQKPSTKPQANVGKKPKMEYGSSDTIAVPARMLMDISALMDQTLDGVRDLDTAFSAAKMRALMPLDEARKVVAQLLVGASQEKLSRGPATSSVKQEPSDVRPVAIAAANNNPPSRKQHVPAPAASDNDYCHAWMTLLEYCVKMRCAFPTLAYEESGPSHQRQYLCTLTLNGAVYRPPQPSQTKKSARREASAMALRAVVRS